MRICGILSSTNFYRIFSLCLLFATTGCCCLDGHLMNQAGIRQYNRGHYAQARHRFARALRHDPCNPDYRHNLAMALQREGNVTACEQILRHNITLDAMHQPTYHSLAQLMVAQGRGSEAQELVTSWAATQPYVPESNIELAWLQRQNGDPTSAEQSLQTALRADPSNPVALSHLGQLYQGTGRSDQAVAYYQRSLAADWNQPEVHSRLATLTDSPTTSRSAMMQNAANPSMVAGGPMFGESMLASSNMMNDPMMANGPIMSDPMMAAGSTMPSAPVMTSAIPMPPETDQLALVGAGPAFGPKIRRRDLRRGNWTTTAANSTVISTGWVPSPSNVEPTIASYQPQPTTDDAMLMSQVSVPPLPGSSLSAFGGQQTGPTPIAQFDPAHANDAATEITAALPVVEPH